MSIIKNTVLSCLKPFDIAVARRSELEALRNNHRHVKNELGELRDKYLIQQLPLQHHELARSLFAKSKSQIRQDIFALAMAGFKRSGYFVEFGATDGEGGSNTWLLEHEFGWNGILSEPARIWHKKLRANRKAHISEKCVWTRSGEKVSFTETDAPALSTISTFEASDSWAESRKQGRTYEVETVSLVDLLSQFNAPREIDYLSIDTEGSELQILSAFDFSKYRISAITCEHNYTPDREKIRELLEGHGYTRKFEDISQFDDWYFRSP